MNAKPIHCPKCRALGLMTDCTDRMIHAQQSEAPMSGSFSDIDTDDLDLEVTITFPISIPASVQAGYGPRESATRMRDAWVENPDELMAVVVRALSDEFELSVRTFSEA